MRRLTLHLFSLPNTPMQDHIRYHLLKQVQDNPKITQRELAQSLGISLGKVNYCLHALISKGLVKADNFSKSRNKPAYFYYLTPRGLEEKLRVTKRFFQAKLKEYELIRQEIEKLREELHHESKVHDTTGCS